MNSITIRSLKKIEERSVKQILELLILGSSKNEPISGYWIISYIRETFNVWLSAGTVYSTLKNLEKIGFIELDGGNHKKKSKHYRITKSGEKTLQLMLMKIDYVTEFIERKKI